MRAGFNIETRLRHFLPEIGSVVFELIAQRGRLAEHIQYGDGSAGDGGSEAIGEEIGPAPLAQHLDHLFLSAGEAAAGAAERLAQRSGNNIYPPHDPTVLVCPAARLAEEAGGMALVD